MWKLIRFNIVKVVEDKNKSCWLHKTNRVSQAIKVSLELHNNTHFFKLSQIIFFIFSVYLDPILAVLCNSPSRRLLIGLLVTRLIQYRFRFSGAAFWLFASAASSLAPSCMSGPGGSPAFEHGSEGAALQLAVSVTFALSASSGGLLTESSDCSSSRGTSPEAGKASSAGGDSSANRGGFSVICWSVRLL